MEYLLKSEGISKISLYYVQSVPRSWSVYIPSETTDQYIFFDEKRFSFLGRISVSNSESGFSLFIYLFKQVFNS